MNSNFVIKRCNSCGAVVLAIRDCKCGDCGIICCGEKMKELIPNSVDSAFEKHVPTYEIAEGKIKVRVNHVMEEEHYIEWIACVADNLHEIKYFEPGDMPVCEFEYAEGSELYAYCNKHALWKTKVE